MIGIIVKQNVNQHEAMLLAWFLMSHAEKGSFYSELCRSTMLEF